MGEKKEKLIVHNNLILYATYVGQHTNIKKMVGKTGTSSYLVDQWTKIKYLQVHYVQN